jgi:hypothetical protein
MIKQRTATADPCIKILVSVWQNLSVAGKLVRRPRRDQEQNMVSIQVEEQTAKALETAAVGVGISVAEYIKLLQPTELHRTDAKWDSLEKDFIDLSVDGKSQSTFSRADIYLDHD